MIPKIIHCVWVGNKPIPQSVKDYMISWKKFAPDYKIMIHGNDILKKIDSLYVQQAIKERKWAFVSDYIRLFVLQKYGGIYLDTDVELTGNIDKFLKHDFFMGFEKFQGIINLNTAFIGATKNNKIVKDLLCMYDKLSFINKDGSLDLTPNPKRFSQYFGFEFNGTKSLNGENAIKLSKSIVFYPYWYFCIPVHGKKNFAIHHFDGSWLGGWDRKTKLKIGKFNILRFQQQSKTDDEPVYRDNEKILFKMRVSANKFYAFTYRNE